MRLESCGDLNAESPKPLVSLSEIVGQFKAPLLTRARTMMSAKKDVSDGRPVQCAFDVCDF